MAVILDLMRSVYGVDQADCASLERCCLTRGRDLNGNAVDEVPK